MALIALYTSSGLADHLHVQEDLSSQVDGYRTTFTTAENYMSGSLLAIYNGVTYTKDNDFSETDTNKFSFPFDGYGVNDCFPPKIGKPLYVTYRKSLSI